MPKNLLEGMGSEPTQQKQPVNLLAEQAPQEQPQEEEQGFWSSVAETAGNVKDSVVKGAADLGIGMYLGALESAGGLVQKGSSLVGKVLPAANEYVTEPLGEHIKNVRRAYSQTGVMGGPGRITGNIAGFAPLGGALGAIGKLPQAASTVAGRVGLTGAAGAAQGGLVGAASYDYSNPESLVNVPGAVSGAVGGGMLNPATQALSVLKTRSRADEVIKDAYNNIIKSVSQKVGKAKTRGEAEALAIKETQRMAKFVKGKEKGAWGQLMSSVKDKQLDGNQLGMLKQKAKMFLTENADELPAGMAKWLNKHIIAKKQLSFGQLKELRTLYRDHRDRMWKKLNTGDVTRNATKNSGKFYDDITQALRDVADKNGVLEKFITANSFSKEANRFQGILSESLAKIATDKATAAKFIQKLVSPKSAATVKENLDLVGGQAAQSIRAKELKDIAIKSMNKDGSFNLTSFHNAITKQSGYEGILKGTKQEQMMMGLQKALADFQAKGSLDLGASAGFSPMWHIGNKMLGHLTGPSSVPLRKQLIQYGLINKNDRMKQYLGNKITEKFIRAGVTVINKPEEQANVLDVQSRRKK